MSLKKKECKIILENNEYSGLNITFFSDSMAWQEYHGITEQIIYDGQVAYTKKVLIDTMVFNTFEVLEIRYVDRGKGAFEGSLVGILLGSICSFLIGYVVEGDTDVLPAEGAGIIYAVIIGIPVGAILGGLCGHFKGSKQRYIFQNK